MDTVRELRHQVEDLTDDLNAQYGRKTPFCEVLHFELGLPQTRREDAASVIEQARKQEIEIDDDSIKLTTEHEELHEALRRVVVDSMAQGLDATQLAAQMYAVGRRAGLKEAAMLLGDS